MAMAWPISSAELNKAVSFHPNSCHATAVFGTLDATNDPRKLATGQAIVLQSDAGKITSVQFPFAPLYQPPRPT